MAEPSYRIRRCRVNNNSKSRTYGVVKMYKLDIPTLGTWDYRERNLGSSSAEGKPEKFINYGTRYRQNYEYIK